MRRLCFAALGAVFALCSVAAAENRKTVGMGGLFSNDVFTYAPQFDRWRTGSGVFSLARAPEWSGELPTRMGELLEFRLAAELITPDRIASRRDRRDRPYAEKLSLGVHTHFQRRKVEYSLGFDLVLTGEQTGLETFQGAIHDVLGLRGASASNRAARIGNGVHPTLTFEIGREFEISDQLRYRPFIEVQGGVETLVRVGGDLYLGRVASDALLVRDSSTGHRYAINRGQEAGWGAVLGGDIAYVAHSALLPEDRLIQLTSSRTRLRAGMRWHGEKMQVFYGLSWLGKEFTRQREEQVVGSLNISFKF